MKEENTDPIRELFREGLKDLHAEPDEAVWSEIQRGYKDRRRGLFFWIFSACIALTILAGAVMVTQDFGTPTATENQATTSPTPLPTEKSPEKEAASPGSSLSGKEEMASLSPSNTPSVVSSSEDKPGNATPSSNASPVSPSPKSSPSNTPTAKSSTQPAPTPTAVPGTKSAPDKGDETGDATQPIAHVPAEPEPQPVQGSGTPGPYLALLTIDNKDFFIQNVAPQTAEKKTVPEKDSTIRKAGQWFVSASAGMVDPHVYLSNGRIKPDFIKTNQSNRPGFSTAIGVMYQPRRWFSLGSGIEYQTYTTSSSMATWGYFDSVEYIMESRATGYIKRFDSLSAQFEQRFNWVSIPLDLHLQTQLYGPVFGEMSFGMGINWMMQKPEHPGLGKYVPEQDIADGLKALHLSMRAGAGVVYKATNWSYFASLQFNALTRPIYNVQYFTETHHFHTWRLGVRYCFK